MQRGCVRYPHSKSWNPNSCTKPMTDDLLYCYKTVKYTCLSKILQINCVICKNNIGKNQYRELSSYRKGIKNPEKEYLEKALYICSVFRGIFPCITGISGIPQGAAL